MVAKPPNPRLSSAWTMASVRSKARLEASMISPGISPLSLVRTKFHEASGDYLGQMALLVALGNFDGFVNAAIAECAGHGRSKCPRLFARRAVCHGAVNHYTDRPARHDEEYDDDAFCDQPI